MLVSRISPAPLAATMRRPTASMPVGFLPPWVKISHLPRRHGLGVDGADDALAAETVGGSLGDDVRGSPRGGIEADLVGARQQQRAHVVMAAHAAATVNGTKQASAVRVTRSNMVPRFSCVAWMSRKQISSAPAAS